MSHLSPVPKPFDQMVSAVASSSHNPVAFQRLVVAIPDAFIEETQLAKEIWALTSTNHAEVLLLTLLGDGSRESHIRLQHALVMQMLATTGVRVTSAIVADVDWLAALNRAQQPNDVWLCFAEHLILSRQAQSRPQLRPQLRQPPGTPARCLARTIPIPMSGLITQQLGRPAHIVTGLVQPSKRRRNVPINLLSWLGFAAIIVGGFWMQMRLDQLLYDAGGLLRGIVLSGAIALELGVLMVILRASR